MCPYSRSSTFTSAARLRSSLCSGCPDRVYSESFQRFIFVGLTHSTLSHKLTSLFKRHMTPPSAHCAGPWGWHSTPALFDTLLLTATKVIPSFTRLAIVRWYLDTEPDVHFRLRPYLTRRTPCRCGCGVLTSFYPDGLRAGAVAPSHLSPLYGWRIPSLPDTPTAFDRFFSSPPHPPLPPPLCPTWTPRGQVPSPTLDFLPAPLRRLLACPCILCNQGDNSVQHWLLFCPVTALAGSLLLNRPWTTRLWFFSKSSSLSQRAILAGLWDASRQLCHERSGLPPPSLEPPPAYSSSPFHLASLLVDRALALIPAPFRPIHIQQSVPLHITPGCFRDSISFRNLTIELEGHPQYYGSVPTTSAAIPADYVISILPMRSPIPKRLFTFQATVPSPPNCTLQFRLCSCGAIHGYLVSLTPLAPHSPLHVGDPTTTQESDFVLHFDGGAFRDLGVGGAGAVLWLHSHGRLQLLSSRCIPIKLRKHYRCLGLFNRQNVLLSKGACCRYFDVVFPTPTQIVGSGHIRLSALRILCSGLKGRKHHRVEADLGEGIACLVVMRRLNHHWRA